MYLSALPTVSDTEFVWIPEAWQWGCAPVGVRGETLQRVRVEDVDHIEHCRWARSSQNEVQLSAAAWKFGREYEHALAETA